MPSERQLLHPLRVRSCILHHRHFQVIAKLAEAGPVAPRHFLDEQATGSDEQMFGADEQAPGRGQGD